MASTRGKKAPPSGRRQASPAKAPQATVQPISPLGLVGAIAIALVIAGILLFVINSRINAASPLPVDVTTIATVVPGSTTQPTVVAPTVQVSGFTKGNPDAKVTVTEYGDFK
jgi:protein-disulfide isomerase